MSPSSVFIRALKRRLGHYASPEGLIGLDGFGARAVPLGLGEEEGAEEVGDGLIDQRQARPGRPREWA